MPWSVIHDIEYMLKHKWNPAIHGNMLHKTRSNTIPECAISNRFSIQCEDQRRQVLSIHLY
ncbi:hypothetical protein BD311DRAFT_758450 [Dichomitus squalens]|uniref:Uncharacterized protein n=1 Tax=Dichomitus squalens TaxID=114155 RepID=A0A4Q9ML50_9APHY|nr:hypothetical protein BD311DRAFT_758450 [Dichomitus squalens]